MADFRSENPAQVAGFGPGSAAAGMRSIVRGDRSENHVLVSGRSRMSLALAFAYPLPDTKRLNSCRDPFKNIEPIPKKILRGDTASGGRQRVSRREFISLPTCSKQHELLRALIRHVRFVASKVQGHRCTGKVVLRTGHQEEPVYGIVLNAACGPKARYLRFPEVSHGLLRDLHR